MHISLLHLSDIHFLEGKNVVYNRIDNIVAAIRSTLAETKACFIVVTGDIAFSGKSEEYSVANGFMTSLKEKIRGLREDLVVELIVIPGNHDCNFDRATELRNVMISGGSLVGHQLNFADDSIVREMTVIQDDFFAFLTQVEKADGSEKNGKGTAEVDSDSLGGVGRLYYEREFAVGERRLRFGCYNTAWMSQQREMPAQLLFPSGAISVSDSKCDVIVAAFHHPTQWLQPDNARVFKALVEDSSDLILSGHEHIPAQYTKRTGSGDITEYVEGAVLQDESMKESGFNLIEIDLEEAKQRHTLYSWASGMYERDQTGQWRAFDRSQKLRTREFQNSPTFEEYLDDAGAAFSHPAKPKLSLEDIFVYPDLDSLPIEKSQQENESKSIVYTEDVFRYVISNPEVIFTGAGKAGKTSLAKKLYKDLQGKHLVPVLISGDGIKSQKSEDFARLVERSFVEQYSAELVERYRQLDIANKVLLVDDFHCSPLNRKGHNLILRTVRKQFGQVILFASDLFQIKEIAQGRVEPSELVSFRHAEIRDFGHRLRLKLIEKWITLDREYTADPGEIQRKVASTENIVDTLLGRKLVPAHPIFVLSMLQLLEAHTDLRTASGEYGYFYEAFITQRLNKHRVPSITLNMLYNATSIIAFKMFIDRRKSLSDEELSGLVEQYFRDYKIRFSLDQFTAILEKSEVINKDAEGKYRFKYNYAYYYFVAKYIALHLYTTSQSDELRRHIDRMVGKLYVEDFANIILFLVYLTNDEKIISKILSEAQSVYPEYDPFDLDTHVEFLNRLQLEAPPLQLNASDTRENKDQQLKVMDSVEERFDVDDDRTMEDDIAAQEDQELNDILRINVAFKTLQIMGQILRNFPGTLPGDLKLEMTREAYLLSLRTLRMLLRVVEDNLDDFRVLVAGLVKERHSLSDEDPELVRKSDRLLCVVISAITYTVIKRISGSVGSQHLKETYRELMLQGSSIPIDLIDLSIKLDHFENFPEAEVGIVHSKVERKLFPLTILRYLVRDHFHLFHENLKIRQRVCAKLDIKLADRKMIEGKDMK